jgi:hypothetical protein
MPLLLSGYLARTDFWRVARLLAVLALFAMATTLRAQEYEVDGAIELKLTRPDGRLSKDFHGSFRVSVNGCAWLIQVTETNDWGIPLRREVGTRDGKEMFEMVVPYEPISPSDAVQFDVKAGQPGFQLASSGLVTSNAIPVGNLDSSFTGHLWLMFASGCYFRTAAAGQLTPVYDFRATPYVNSPRLTMKASWELTSGPAALPSRVTYFGPDGTTSAVYAASGFTNVGALTLPNGFHFTQPGTGYKEVSAVVTAVRPTCSRADLRPVLKQRIPMIDMRWYPRDLHGFNLTAYQSDHWPTVEQAQGIYYSARAGDSNAPKPKS